MRLILIRHGESIHNQQRVMADLKGCTGMTEQGVQQVRQLAARLQASGELKDIRVLLSSPVLRAYQTAELLSEKLPIDTLEPEDNLREIHLGEADGMTQEDYRSRYGGFDLMASPNRPIAPQGESWVAFLSRVQTMLERLSERFEGQIVVGVTHAGFIMATLLVLFDIPRPGTGTFLSPQYTSLTEWSFSKGRWQLERYNDTFHLLARDGYAI